jgi:ribonuclease III
VGRRQVTQSVIRSVDAIRTHRTGKSPDRSSVIPRPRTSADLATLLGIDAAATPLLEQALTHRSFAYEHAGMPSNERLEFLGETVITASVTRRLFDDFPAEAEGELAKRRAGLVNMRCLAGIAREIGLGEFVHLGRQELASGGADKSSILADTFEAVIGALCLTAGPAEAGEMAAWLIMPEGAPGPASVQV